jgi:hypothetical protein
VLYRIAGLGGGLQSAGLHCPHPPLLNKATWSLEGSRAPECYRITRGDGTKMRR